MVGESDSDTVISKRPKTKPIIEKALSNISDIEEPEDNLLQESKNDNSAFSENVKQKKAIKRSRESEEESSVTSDDEAMSKKRIRKNSDDRCVSFRPKKVVSDAARRRREAIMTVREKKMAALDTDSESDSNEVSEPRLIHSKKIQGGVDSFSDSKFDEDSFSKAKQHLDDEVEKVARNTKSLINSVKDRKSQREKTSEKTCAKNDDSSSAYNSDSENGENSKESSENIRFEVEKPKCNSDNTSVEYPKMESCHSDTKSEKCVDSESDVDNSNHKHTSTAHLENTFKKCDESENGKSKGKSELNILQKNKNCVETNVSDDEQNTSKGDSEGRNVSKEEKVKQKNLNTHSSCNENSSDEEKVNKKSTKEEKEVNSSKKSLINKQCLQKESSSDTDKSFKKIKSVKNINSLGELKLLQRKKSDSSSNDNTSDDDCSIKNTKSQQKNVERKGKTLKQSMKIQNSSQEESFSDNEHLSKKTKSSTRTQNSSDSDKSDNSFELKSQNKGKPKNKDSGSSDSDLENCKPSNKTKSLKYNKTQLKPKITVTKKEISESSDSEGESKQVKEKKINQKVFDKSERLKKEPARSTKVSNETVNSSDDPDLPHKRTKESETVNSSDDSDPTHRQAKESKGKVRQRKSDLKIGSKTVQKTSDESELSSSESENNLRKKQMNSTKKPSEEEKGSDDSESSSREKKSKNKLNKSVKVPKTVKKEQISSDSDSTRELPKHEFKHEISDSANSSDSECDGKNHRGSGNKTVKTKEANRKKSSLPGNDRDSSKNDSKRKKKELGKWEARIINLKKYVRACGIHIKNYATFWEGCKNDKQKADKLSQVLEDFGVKGRPSMQMCKKLREAAERKREIEQLDLSNIIDTEEDAGRTRCRRSRAHSIEKKPSQILEEQKAAERAADWKQRFSRIKDLVDSDSSSG